MWLGSVLAPSGGAQPLLLALMANGGSPGKKGNAYTVLCKRRVGKCAGAAVGKAGWLALHVCEGLRVASVPAQGNSLGLPIVHNVSSI